MSFVLFISSLVVFYSREYMLEDKNKNRFIFLILLFVFSIIILIISPNLVRILLGWDGLGLVSYCLVIYFQNIKSYNAGILTALSNRVGDVLLLISISWIINFGSWSYYFYLDYIKNDNLIKIIGVFIILAAITKRAQIPFSSWLPAAIAAPTPVSALVHSSTLVTAGVYLLIRFNSLIRDLFFSKVLLILGCLTIFISGLGANFEIDLKKIIALSTLSQLGVIIFSLSIKLIEVSLFHLLTHAIFKSILFMCAGVIIHNISNNQDIRFISIIIYNFPIVRLIFNCSSISLCGIPFLSGFFSKDLILELFLINKFNKFIIILLFISMGLTVRYSLRLIFYSFIKIPQLNIYLNYKSILNKMGVSIYLLFLFSIIKGLLLRWILFSIKNIIFLTIFFKLIIYIFIRIGLIMGILLPKLFLQKIIYRYCNIYIKIFILLWFIPILYINWIPKILKFSNKILYYLDFWWIEYLIGGGILKIFKIIFKLDYYNKNYLFLIVILIIIIIFIIF